MQYFLEALRKAEAINDSMRISKFQYSLGTHYFWKEELEKSLEHLKNSVRSYPSNGSPQGKVNKLMAIGVVLQNDPTKLEESLDYQLKAFEIIRDNKLHSSKPIALNNLAETYYQLGDTLKSYDLLKESVKISDSINDRPAMIYAEFLLGEFHYKTQTYDKTLPHFQYAIAEWEALDSKKDLPRAYELIEVVYEKLGMFKERAYTLEKLLKIRAELFDIQRVNAAAELEEKYQSEKNELIIEQEKSQSILAIQETEIAKSKQRSQIIIFSIIGLFLIVGGLYFYSAFNKQKRANEIIEMQRESLAEKSKEVADSINYAQRIQNAILPPLSQFDSRFDDAFVYYSPKDIISGDFYWFEKVDNKTFFAVADCTGYGVPGALVSILCHNALNRAVNELGIYEPGKILDVARENIIKKFSISGNSLKDGMDISLCVYSGNTLTYAGANNPLWIVREGELLETKADKQPIGEFENTKPLNTHRIEMQSGDAVYLFSDGYADQFGGEKGKKFKSANLKRLLVSIADDKMTNQRDTLKSTLEQWKGDMEQVDDICVMGVRF